MRNYLHIFIIGFLFFNYSCSNDQSFGSSSNTTLFQLQAASQTGIDFSNRVVENMGNNIMNNDYIFAGAGIAAGDLNKDGLPDLVFVSNQGKPQIYLNQKNFKFKDVSENSGMKAVAGWSAGVNIVDINGDGYNDVYICRGGEHLKDPNIRRNLLYINNGDLSFTERAKEYGLDCENASTMATFFDYDLDGDLDVYVLNYPIGSPIIDYTKMVPKRTNPPSNQFTPYDSDKFYRNDNGKFTDITKDAGISNWGYGLGIGVGDINKDGYPDVYVTNDFEVDNFYYVNNGDGTFTESLTTYFPHVSYFAMGMDIADFNNDSHLDIFEVEMLPENRKRAIMNMSPMDRGLFEILINSGQAPQYMRNSLHLNRGNGHYSDIAQFAGVNKSDWSWGTRIVDLDDDGHKDIYIANGIARDMKDRDFQMKGNELAKSAKGKLTIDKMHELVPTNPVSNYAFQNNGDLKFKKVADKWGLDYAGFSNAVVTADLDQDGDLDLVVGNVYEAPLVYKNRSREKGNNYLNFTFQGGKDNPTGIGNKVKIYTSESVQYEELYPVRGYQSYSEPLIHFGLGKVETVDKVEIIWANGSLQILENVQANQTIQVKHKTGLPKATFAAGSNTLLAEKSAELGIDFDHVERYYDDFRSEILIPHKMSQNGPKLAVGDINGDGLEDFYAAGPAKQAGALYIQQDNGSFNQLQSPSFDADKMQEDIGASFFDADGDGDLDLYVVSGSNEFENDVKMYQDRLYLNQGSGNFTKSRLPEITASGSCVVPVDFDNDGDIDLFVGGRVVPQRYPNDPRSYILQNDGGKFTDVTSSVASGLENIGMVTDAVWTDVDGDNDKDLIVVGEWMAISLWKNNDGKLELDPSPAGLENTEGWWNSITACDIDNDGDDDYIVGNIGLNHKFKASAEEPFQVFGNDFDNSGTYDIVLAFHQDEEVFPVRGRDCSSEQMPFITEKFPDFESFGDANLVDIYGQDLENSLKKEAKQFASVLVINEGGSFKVKKLPTEAQFSAVNGAELYDVNGDGKDEIILAGNMFKTEAETSRADASIGTIIEIDDKLNMTCLPTSETGFFAAGDAKDLKLVKTKNGKSLILVANNHGKLQVFK